MLEILEHQQNLTKNQWKIIFAAVLGDMLDFFDYGLIAFALAFIVGHWKLTMGNRRSSCSPPGSVRFPVL
jgi:MFS transporter, putative metabolite:H+ symporter